MKSCGSTSVPDTHCSILTFRVHNEEEIKVRLSLEESHPTCNSFIDFSHSLSTKWGFHISQVYRRVKPGSTRLKFQPQIFLLWQILLFHSTAVNEIVKLCSLYKGCHHIWSHCLIRLQKLPKSPSSVSPPHHVYMTALLYFRRRSSCGLHPRSILWSLCGSPGSLKRTKCSFHSALFNCRHCVRASHMLFYPLACRRFLSLAGLFDQNVLPFPFTFSLKWPRGQLWSVTGQTGLHTVAYKPSKLKMVDIKGALFILICPF